MRKEKWRETTKREKNERERGEQKKRKKFNQKRGRAMENGRSNFVGNMKIFKLEKTNETYHFS